MRLCIAATLLALVASEASAEELRVTSPNGQLEINVGVNAEKQPTYSIAYRGRPIIAPSPLGLDLGQTGALGQGLAPASSSRNSVDQTYQLVAGKTKVARDHYNELTVEFREAAREGGKGRSLQLVFRAYDDGAAFRYRLPPQPQGTVIAGELTRFDFARDYDCWGLNLGQFTTSHEGEYDPIKASLIRDHNLYETPLVCKTGDEGTTFAIAEADVSNYAGAYLRGRGDGGLGLQIRLSPRMDNPDVAVQPRIGTETISPWRVLMIGDQPADLIQSTLITNLNPPPAFDASWVKPGKAAWDWWNGPTLKDLPNAGMNDATMKKFIDFASSARLEYMLIDDGWYPGSGGGWTTPPGTDVTRSIPQINLPELVAYGRERGVGIWLWVHWKALDAQMDEALAFYQRLGIKGIKVDFMNRDDQEMVEWYHRVLAKAAQHKLLVNFHSAYRPTGLVRTYPNYLTQEGVLGAEYNKWSRRITARHNVTLAFTRLLLGPMDYTPGGFDNVSPAEFTSRMAAPMVQTTRAHGLAMFVVYDSPFTTVADSPDRYQGQPGLDFISDVPVTWDETRAIAGEIGEYVVLARRKGKDWYVAAMTNESGRNIELPLNFLGKGQYKVTAWTDGEQPSALKIEQRSLARNDRQPMTLTLAPNGGAALRFTAE